MPERTPPYVDAEEYLALFRALGSPEQLRRRCYIFDEMARERREWKARLAALDTLLEERKSPEYAARQAAITAMLDDRRNQQWFGDRTKKAALLASAIVAGWLGLMQLLDWFRDWIASLK